MISHATIALITRSFEAGEEIAAIAAAAKCHPNTVRTVIAGEHRLQIGCRIDRAEVDALAEERAARIPELRRQVRRRESLGPAAR